NAALSLPELRSWGRAHSLPVASRVTAALERALARDPKDRFATASAFVEALDSRSVRRHSPTAIALAVGAAAAVVWGGIMALGAAGIGPAASLVARGTIRSREPVLVTDFVIVGADSGVAQALAWATRTALEQSPEVVVMSGDAIGAALGRMRKPRGGTLDLGLSRELAQREG